MYYTIQAANNKGADQTAQMRRLICAFVVHIWHKQILTWLTNFSQFKNLRENIYNNWGTILLTNKFSPIKTLTNIYIFNVVILDKALILDAFHFSMKNIEISQWKSLRSHVI